LPVGGWRDLTGGRPFIVLSPHPDDESLGAGGLIALARRHEQDVAVVLLTDGSMSHPNSRAYPRERLVTTRRSELAQAARVLSLDPSRLIELGLPDAATPKSGPDFDRALECVSRLVIALSARTVFVTWAHDPHFDHEAVAYLAEQLRRG